MKKTLLYLIVILVAVSLFLACTQTKTGHITIQSLYFQTESGVTFTDVNSLYIDHYEVNGTVFRGIPYTIYNLPGDKYYSYSLKAYDAEGIAVASTEGQWYVIADSTDTQTATLTVVHQHSFDDSKWVNDQAYHWHGATCGHAAQKDKAEHEFVEDVCTACGFENHTFSDTLSYDDNNHWYAATCGHDVKKDVEPHTFGPETKTEATCTKVGKVIHQCNVCGKVVVVSTTPATGHTPSGEWTVTVEPTCFTEGEKTNVCATCGETYTEAIPHIAEHEDDGTGVCRICRVVLEPYIGPAGGYVFYDKGEYSDGWRYLEAAPADLQVDDPPYFHTDGARTYGRYFGCLTADRVPLYINGTETYNAENCTLTGIGTGKRNTELIINALGEEAYISEAYITEMQKFSYYAARLCDLVSVTVNEVTYDDWFLPSKDELNLVYHQLAAKGLTPFTKLDYWSSSEDEKHPALVWVQDFDDGEQFGYLIHIDGPQIRPIRAF